ncbi:MAG: hypothetical protein KAW17_07360 [Candidatus Eisenbacteria sp.]|nr:hypothetical protein [Candidatus Eisenbacteria bacterium]
MRAKGALWAFLLCGFLVPRVWSSPLDPVGQASGSRPIRGYHAPGQQLATVTIGFSASYAPFDFPRTNESLAGIAANLRKLGYPAASLGDLGSDMAVLGYAQVLIWEGLGFRLSLLHVKAKPPEGFGSLRAEIDGSSSPVHLSYSAVKEFHIAPVRVVVGAGVDQYRWSMEWNFHEIGEDPLEVWEWEGSGSGGHGFVEVVVPIAGLQFLVGAVYRKGLIDMDAVELPPTTQMSLYPRHYEEDVNTVHLYGGITFNIF